MKILHVTSGLSRLEDGVRGTVMALSRAQTELGDDVAVLGLETSDWIERKEIWAGIQVKALRVFGPRSLGYAPSMTSSILKCAPDIVHLHGLWMHPNRSVLQWHRRTGRPYVLSIHGMLSEAALSYSPWKKHVASVLFQNNVLAAFIR